MGPLPIFICTAILASFGPVYWSRSWRTVAQRDVETEAGPGSVEAEGGVVQRSLRPRKTLPGTSPTPDRHLIRLQKVGTFYQVYTPGIGTFGSVGGCKVLLENEISLKGTYYTTRSEYD